MSAIYPEYLVLVLGVVIDARYTGALPISTRYLPHSMYLHDVCMIYVQCLLVWYAHQYP